MSFLIYFNKGHGLSKIMPLTTLLIVAILLASCNSFQQNQKDQLTVIATSDDQWTGVAVSDDQRIFVNYPYWSEHVPVSVAEIINGEAKPFPNEKWNDRTSEKSFQAVQSVYTDGKNQLWVLDTRNPKFQGVKDGGPVLFQFDLATNRLSEEYHFPDSVWESNSYFNDVRIDTARHVAFITDSGNGAIVVLELRSGNSRRLLADSPLTKSETNHLICNGIQWNNSVDADGIAIDPSGEYLYFIALTGHTLYRVKIDYLMDHNLSEHELETLVEPYMAVPATDGMLFDRQGNLWLGALETDGVNMITPEGVLINMLQDSSIRWADSFAKDLEGNIYFTTSQIYLPEKDRQDYQLFCTRANPNDSIGRPLKALIAITSHGTLGEKDGEPTGYYLSEVTHAYYEFVKAGIDVEFVSPLGGESPVTGLDLKDPINARFMKDSLAQQRIRKSLRAEDVQPKKYNVIYFAGGHGVMWDFPDNSSFQEISRTIYEHGGIVAAVCHGPAALINVKKSSGRHLIEGRNLTTFTNEEEKAVKLDDVVPFPLETELMNVGAKIQKTAAFEEKVVIDQRLVTGQNPASAKGVAEGIVLLLQHQR